MRRILSLALFALLVAVPVTAQTPVTGGTVVTQTAAEARSCTPSNANPAVNTQATVTITPNGQLPYVYIYSIDFSAIEDATATDAAGAFSLTSTNFGGWKYFYAQGAAGTANQLLVDKSWTWPSGAKSPAAGTAVTIVSPAAVLHKQYSINVCYTLAAQ